MKLLLRVVLILIVTLVIIWLLGPKPGKVNLDLNPVSIDGSLTALEEEIRQRESAMDIRPGNETLLVWADSVPTQTEYCLVYLHGFSASPFEGAPVHSLIADRYGMNLYAPLLPHHGLVTDEALIDIKAEDWLQASLDAIAVGKRLGKKVILMSCSTGGTMGIYGSTKDPSVVAQIMYSPNIDLFDPLSSLLTKPWGLEMARMVKKSKYNCWEPKEGQAETWYTCQRLEGIVQLRHFVNLTMKEENFKQIDEPIFVGCYYKDDVHQDSTVSVSAIRSFFEQVSTPADKKRLIEFANGTGHVICSPTENPNWRDVVIETQDFIEEVLGQKPIKNHQNTNNAEL